MRCAASCSRPASLAEPGAAAALPAPRPWASAAVGLGLPALAVAWAWPQGLPPLRAAAIVVAWAGTGLLVASLVLMLREPRLARALGGLEAMLRWHHRAGVLGYLLLLLHPLALAGEAWLEAPARAWEALAPLQQDWPVQLGWAALVLLMGGLAATFMPALSYRRWRGWHFLLGFAVLLGLAHVLALLGTAPLSLAGAAGVAAAALLAWRLAVVDQGLRAHAYRVARVEHPAAAMIEAQLVPLGPRLLGAPGQFVLARFLDRQRYAACGAFHPFTLSDAQADGRLKVAIKALGPCSAELQALAPGALVQLQGPFGEFLAAPPLRPQLWVAGGIGITPFIAVLRQRACTQPTTLLYLVRRTADAAFLPELQALAQAQPLFRLRLQATGDGAPDLERCLAELPDLATREVQACGPPGLMQALEQGLRRHGVPGDRVHREAFDFR